LAEVEAVVAEGAVEVTLLGQNVNSYGAGFGDRGAFAKLLRAVGQVKGLERLRFTSPHPAAFSDDVIAAMAETAVVAHQLHMPVQSGSDRILRAMRRSYRAARFLGLLERVRTAMPGAAISTDIIVGFPGETESDFQDTLDLVAAARFTSAFTFQYSVRPGTPAATMPDQVPSQVVSERFDRLVELQDRISEADSMAQIGRPVEVLVSVGEGRKDAQRARVSGRSREGRLVHLGLPGKLETPQQMDDAVPRPGDIVQTVVTGSAPHHLIADAALTGGSFHVIPYAERRPDATLGRRSLDPERPSQNRGSRQGQGIKLRISPSRHAT
jgi:tRNA-2-methylthio-N6-dimethylallyladenosine synthase